MTYTNIGKLIVIKLYRWTDEDYEKAIKALDNINPHWSADSSEEM